MESSARTSPATSNRPTMENWSPARCTSEQRTPKPRRKNRRRRALSSLPFGSASLTLHALTLPRFLPPPPGRFLARRRLSVVFDQQLAAGGFEGHAQFIVTEEAVGWIFRHDFDQGVAGRLADFRD